MAASVRYSVDYSKQDGELAKESRAILGEGQTSPHTLNSSSRRALSSTMPLSPRRTPRSHSSSPCSVILDANERPRSPRKRSRRRIVEADPPPLPPRKHVYFGATSLQVFHVSEPPSRVRRARMGRPSMTKTPSVRRRQQQFLPPLPLRLASPQDAAVKPKVNKAVYLPPSPLLVTSKVIGNNRSSTSFLNDPALFKSKVFRRRLDASATKMQALVRGWLTRLHAQDCQWAAEVGCQVAAAVAIQALVRGHLGRLTAQLQRLQQQFTAIQRQRMEELQAVETWKLEQQSAADRAKDGQQLEAERQLLRMNALHAAFHGLSMEQSELQSNIDDLQGEQKQLQEQTRDLTRQARKVARSMRRRTKENAKLELVLGVLEERCQEYQMAMKQYARHEQFESTMCRLAQWTARRIAGVVANRAWGDDEWYQQVTALSRHMQVEPVQS